MSGFPENAQALTAEALSSYLRDAGLLSAGEVVAVQSKIIGTGKMGDNARVSLQYSEPQREAPSTLIAKFPAADETARAMAGAGGAYYAEVMFYRELAAGTTMKTPRIYASELSEDRTSFLLLMEDMSPAEPGNNLEAASRQHTELALREAAKLAAAYYDDDSIGERDYVQASARDDGGAFGQELLIQNWPAFIDRYGHGISDECRAFGEHYVQNHSRFVSRFQGPKTLAHGDLRSENILFYGDTATVVDWQTMAESSAVTDAAYFLGGSVAPEDRRAWEHELIERYREQLDSLGVTLSAGQCWEQYREYAMHGLLITILGAAYSTPDDRSDKMFLTMIQRHLQHCVDVHSAEFLD